MAQTSRRQIAAALDEWRELQARKLAVETERDDQLARLRRAFDRKCAPFVTAAAIETEPINRRLAELEAAISSFLEAGYGLDGSVKYTHVVGTAVDGSRPVARVLSSAVREIEPSLFFERVSDRSERFWDCLKVQVQRAEQWLGKLRVDELAKLRVSHRIAITLEPENEKTDL